MTSVTVFVRSGSKGHILGFAALGHTGYADAGEDLVCCAVSALLQTAANALERMRLGGKPPKVRRQPGFLSLMLEDECAGDPPGTLVRRDRQTVLKGFLGGVEDLAAQYPGFIRITTARKAIRRQQHAPHRLTIVRP